VCILVCMSLCDMCVVYVFCVVLFDYVRCVSVCV